MIFSEEKWNNGAEIKEFIKVSSALSFKMMETPLRNAFQLFIVPLLGSQMIAELIEIYKFGPNPDVLERSSELVTERERMDWELLKLCQFANANLAMWYDFDTISVRITDAGFQRQESENGTFKPAYKYQEDNLRQGFKNKGFNMLDQVLDFLYEHIDLYPEFSFSKNYETHTSAIVRTTGEVNDVYFINSSRLIFLRLQTHLRFVEEMFLKPEIGDEMYDELIGWLTDGIAEDKKHLVESLRLACGRYMIILAVKRLLAETGSITDRGLYFTTIQPGKNGNEFIGPVDTDRLAIQIQNLQCDADAYRSALTRLIRTNFSDRFVGDPARVFDRDNDNKNTFWT